MKFIFALLAVSIAVAISTVADVFLKKSQLSNYNYVIVGILLYALGAVPVSVGFKLVDFSVVFFIWQAVSVALGLSIGILLFKEDFSWLKVVAFTLSLLAITFSYLATKGK
jgi:multidrug transporter EmrE-like cation transporter